MQTQQKNILEKPKKNKIKFHDENKLINIDDVSVEKVKIELKITHKVIVLKDQ